jgi:hypothetical protein
MKQLNFETKKKIVYRGGFLLFIILHFMIFAIVGLIEQFK